MGAELLMALAAAIPVLAVLLGWKSGSSLAERHHLHHDTYVIASSFTWSIISAMVFMGALGVMLAWLCLLDVFEADALLVLSFFDGFLVTVFVAWLCLRRYKVMLYDGYMRVTPILGPTVTIRYADVSAMEWTRSLLVAGARNVSVFVGHRRRALLWAVLDLDQILIRINRFDVIENVSS